MRVPEPCDIRIEEIDSEEDELNMRFVSLWVAALIGTAVAASNSSIEVLNTWARATVPGASTGAAFMTVRATGEADQLVGASSPVAEHVDVHSSVMNNGIMEMRAMDAVDVVPGRPTTFAPGGLHFMLMGLRHPLAEGSTFPLTVRFRKAGAITVNVRVASFGARSAPD